MTEWGWVRQKQWMAKRIPNSFQKRRCIVFLNHLAETSLPGQQDALLKSTVQLPGSDIPVAKKILADFQRQQQELIDTYNEAETQSPDFYRSSNFQGTLDSLVAEIRNRFSKEISAAGFDSFSKAAKQHTSHIKLFRTPRLLASNHMRILNGDPGPTTWLCFTVNYAQSYTTSLGSLTYADAQPPTISSTLYTSVSVSGTMTPNSPGCQSPQNATHIPRVTNTIQPQNIGGQTSGSGVCPTCYINYANNQTAANVPFSTTSSFETLGTASVVFCTFSGINVFNDPFLDIPFELAVEYTQSVTETPPTLGQTPHCTCDPNLPDLNIYAITKVQTYEQFWISGGICFSIAENDRQPFVCLALGSLPIDPVANPIGYAYLLIFNGPCTYNP